MVELVVEMVVEMAVTQNTKQNKTQNTKYITQNTKKTTNAKHKTKHQNKTQMECLTLSGPDYGPARRKGAKDEIKRPEGPPAKSRAPEGALDF